MKVTITIECDNAAFGDDPTDEVVRILADWMQKLSDGRVALIEGARLRDINGNTVGRVEVTD